MTIMFQMIMYHDYNVSIIQISYTSSLTGLSDRERYPNFFQMLPSENDIAQAIVALMQNYGWRRIAILTEDGSLFTEVRNMILCDDVAFSIC